MSSFRYGMVDFRSRAKMNCLNWLEKKQVNKIHAMAFAHASFYLLKNNRQQNCITIYSMRYSILSHRNTQFRAVPLHAPFVLHIGMFCMLIRFVCLWPDTFRRKLVFFSFFASLRWLCRCCCRWCCCCCLPTFTHIFFGIFVSYRLWYSWFW